MAKLRSTSGQLEVTGWALYAISWITPSLDGERFGAKAFIDVVRTGVMLVFRVGSPTAIVVGVCLLLGWLANFSPLLLWPPRTRFLWIGAPWIPFLALLVERGVAPSPLPMLYFYPWAIGIGLIHGARLGKTLHPVV